MHRGGGGGEGGGAYGFPYGSPSTALPSVPKV